MNSDPLQAAQAALQRGERIHARKLARIAILQNPRSEAAWLLMARVVDVQEQVIDCLEQALKINPQNQSTMRALRALRRQAERGAGEGVQGAAQQAQGARYQAQGAVQQAQGARYQAQGAVRQVQGPRYQAQGAVQQVQGARQQETKADTLAVVRKKMRGHHQKANWSLIIGSLLVFLVLVIGVVGSSLAPADPLEEHTIIKVGDDWETPPFAPFAVPGFLLGSDQFGRDLLSRILWGVRPTLSMVATVAVVRLLLGTLIGLGAGWFRNRFGRWLDTLISAALSVPVLIVALGAIAMLGAEIGLLAFIVGLSINGWAETARIVRDQTQTIKGQLYVEAAQALGASTFTILSRHILRQVMPMVWMLFAFEISNTLMTTAGLGFLGYYIGGDVWVEVSDFVSRRISGMPELGQMLATAWVNLVQPWPMVITGSIVFVAVLGFNLMGEGLRSRLNPELINRNSLTSRFGRWFSAWFEQRVTYPSGIWLRRSPLHPVMVTVMVLGLTGILYATVNLLAGGASSSALNMPGGHFWVADRGDPFGSLSTKASGPVNPQVLWTVHNSQGFSGGPVVAVDGTLYLPALAGELLALDPNGATLWEVRLPDSPVGSPALAADGTVVLAGSSGGVYAVSSSGTLLWTYQPEDLMTAYSKVSYGPIVSRDGVIYLLIEDNRGDTLLALSPEGELLWQTATGTRNLGVQPRISPDEEYIYLQNVLLNAEDGSLVDITLPSSEDSVLAGREQYVVGGNGLLYLHVGHYLMQWEPGPAGFEIIQTGAWNYRGAGFNQYTSFPVDAGTTRNGNLWLFYSAFYGGTQIIWLDPTGVSLGSSPTTLIDNSRVVAVDGANMAYLCGMSQHGETNLELLCLAFAEGSEEPTWDAVLDEQMQDLLGAALVPGRLYLTTSAGVLYALGDVEQGSAP